MHIIDGLGHLCMRWYTKDLYDKHVGLNEDAFVTNKRAMDDYIIQKNYFKSKKAGKMGLE